ESPAIKGPDEVDTPLLAPVRPRAALFINRQSFGKPPRDAVVCHLQRDHVREFVPERAAPIEVPFFSRRRAIHRYNLAKADPYRPQPWQPKRPHSEVLMVREYLDYNGTLGSEVIPFRKLLMSFLE